MKTAPPPVNEKDRLQALNDYYILDTLEESEYDDITEIAAQICGTPISLVSLIDADRQWFKSRHGLDAKETPRDLAFCAHAIVQPDELLIVRDSFEDIRFADNPLATDNPHVRFYAGAPLVDSEGFALGTLCVIDHKPNDLNDSQEKALLALSKQVVSQMELRKKVRQLEETKRQLEKANKELSNFAYIASHDLKTPLRGIISITHWLKDEYMDKLEGDGKEYVKLLQERANILNNLVNGILNYTRITSSSDEYEEVNTHELIMEIKDLISPPKNFEIKVSNRLPKIRINRAAAQQIFQNLISNGIKYNDKKKGRIEITARKIENDSWEFAVKDNGPGIDKKHHNKIFEMFQVVHNRDRFGFKGTGIGLSTVKKLVELNDGTIKVESSPGKGSAFVFTLHE